MQIKDFLGNSCEVGDSVILSKESYSLVVGTINNISSSELCDIDVDGRIEKNVTNVQFFRLS